MPRPSIPETVVCNAQGVHQRLFHDICQYPSLAANVKRLIFYEPRRPLPPQDVSVTITSPEHAAEEARRAEDVKKIWAVVNGGLRTVDPSVCEGWQQTKESAADLLVLLTRLPNLVSFEYIGQDTPSIFSEDVLESVLVSLSDSPGQILDVFRRRPFRVEELTISGFATQAWCLYFFRIVNLRTGSLRRLDLSSPVIERYFLATEAASLTAIRSIRQLRLSTSFLDPIEVAALIQQTTYLETLDYEYFPDRLIPGEQNLSHIKSAVEGHKAHIKGLSIKVNKAAWDVSVIWPLDIPSCTFADYPALKALEIPDICFFDVPLVLRVKLPPTLEMLVLTAWFVDDVPEMLKDLAAESGRIRSLNTVVVNEVGFRSWEFRQAIDVLGHVFGEMGVAFRYLFDT